MTGCSFSRWSVKRRPDLGACSDSSEDKDDDARLVATCPGETARDDARLAWCRWLGAKVSIGVEDGDESAGEGMTRSSASETWPLSRDAAKLLEISGSDTKAYEDGVDADEVVDIVRTRKCDVRGSSCQTELVVSTFP
jgi:hypothetical protein